MQPATEIHSIQVAKQAGFLLCFPLLAIQRAGNAEQVFQTNTYTLSRLRGVPNLPFLGIANMRLSLRKIMPKLIFGDSQFRTD